ncbi:MAG: hypothetical protein EA407_04785 [Rhodobacteraceae bacterium]|nr:MAG: hypothetical protein EA407_04785 [Paracoccaceae bacterium]
MAVMLDLIIGLGAICAAAYCMVLSRRLRALTRLDGDVGKAIAVLSSQVDTLTHVLREAEASSGQAGSALREQIARADAAARKLELLMAAGQASAEPTPHFSAVAPRCDPEPGSGDTGSAPFDRVVSHAGPDTRADPQRHRETAGAMR